MGTEGMAQKFDDRRDHGGPGASALRDDFAGGAGRFDDRSNCGACGPSLGKRAGD
jgi:hypothetical protein